MTPVPGPWDNDIIHREPCGCVVMRRPYSSAVGIVYCDEHAAAGEMREALGSLDTALMALDSLDAPLFNAVDDYLSQPIIAVRAALARARGEG